MAMRLCLFPEQDGLDQVLVFIDEDYTIEDAKESAEIELIEAGEPVVINLTQKQQEALGAIYVNYPYKSAG
jgi:hypothetical protein